MFELETIMKTYADADGDFEIPFTAAEAREVIKEFSNLKTALRRIRSLDDKNLAKYAKEIASQALHMPPPRS
ncbi:hypothetical protein AYJ54_00845 [Bradyrhizobium centrolobii]|uniref:Uncharacterized protein n=1 Tax=Bradyrhizobium centrolobii TaxID=1505087 RepID=A0A176YIJ3_9BRAD|nr:hypothetical protein [Bradyrhizobium centrolobii]OAF05486.1 hypothetical protein AYJ54_00845 [Bradyrhizobium centrolobii]